MSWLRRRSNHLSYWPSQFKQHSLRIALGGIITLIVLLFVIFPSLVPFKARAATLTWDGGCGGDTSWSCDANWTTDTEPVAGDTVVFDNTSDNNSTVDGAFAGTITTISINSGYDGTITLARSLTTNSNFSQSSGSFTAANQTLDINGSFTLNSGANFTASSGTTSVASTFTINAGSTFTNNGGTVTLDGNGSVTCNSATFNLVTFAHTFSTKTVASDCSLPLGADPTVGGAGSIGIVLNGTLSGSGTLNMGAAGGTNRDLTINSTGVLSGFSGIVTNGDLTVSGATFNAGSYSTFDINNQFILSSSASFTAPSGTMTVAGNFTINAGTTFTHNSGTLTFDGTLNSTLACDSETFNNVTFAHTNNRKTVGSDCSFPIGSNPTVGIGNTPDLTLDGTLSGSGTLTIGNQNNGNALLLNNGAILSGFNGLAAGTLTLSSFSMDFSSYSTFNLGSTYTQNGGTISVPDGADFVSFNLGSSGVFNAPSGNMSVSGSFTLDFGTTFNDNGGTLTFDGTGSATLSCNNETFNLVVFANTSNAKTVSSDCSMPLGSNPSIGPVTLSGTLSGSGTLTTSGTFRINGGYALSGFDGLSTVTFTIQNGATANFGSLSSFVIGGVFTIQDTSIVTVPNDADFNNSFTLSSSSTFNSPAGTATFASNFTLDAGTTFNANGGTVVFDGTSDRTLSCNNATFNLVSLQHTSGKRTVNNGCNLPLGANPTAGSGGNTTLKGALSGSGILTTTGEFILNPGFTLTGFNGIVASTFWVNGATASFSGYNTFDVNGLFFLDDNATFTATSATMTVGGNFRVEAGSIFNHNSGTVLLDGSDQEIVGTTFNNLSKTVATAATLTMPAGSTETILGKLTLKGAAGELLTIISSNSGTQWNLNIQGGQDLNYVAVSDSNSIGDTPLPCNSVDDGGNTNWTFNPGNCNGGGGDSGASQAAVAIINFLLFQLFSITVSDQHQTTPLTLAQHQDLRSELSNFLKEIAQDKTVWVDALKFLGVCAAIMLVIGLLVWLIILWRRHSSEGDEIEDFAPSLELVPPQVGDIVHPVSQTKTGQPRVLRSDDSPTAYANKTDYILGTGDSHQTHSPTFTGHNEPTMGRAKREKQIHGKGGH